MYQKCPINGFEWVEDLYQFDESFIKNYDENSDKGYFFDIDVEYLKNLFNLHKDFPFLTERKKKSKNVISLFATYKIKKTMLII